MAVVIPLSPTTLRVESSTGQLRFERRLKQKILQQMWNVALYSDGVLVETTFEWRDVPEVEGA